MQKKPVTVPVDIYEAPQEMLIILPLGGVDKSSVKLELTGYKLTIRGTRVLPPIKDTLMPQQQTCFRGDFEKVIDIPASAVFDQIQTELSPENILTILVPKVTTPEELVIDIK